MQTQTHIQVSDIPEEGLFLNFLELSSLLPGVDEYTKITSAKGRLEIHKKAQDVEITGHVEAKVNLTCDRCLNHFERKFEADFFYLLQPREEFGRGLKEEHQLTSDDIDVYWYEEGLIKGEELFREQILLQLPMRIICRKDCKGLCPTCGKDLNKGKCNCQDDHSDSPFAILSKLKVAS